MVLISSKNNLCWFVFFFIFPIFLFKNYFLLLSQVIGGVLCPPILGYACGGELSRTYTTGGFWQVIFMKELLLFVFIWVFLLMNLIRRLKQKCPSVIPMNSATIDVNIILIIILFLYSITAFS